MKLVEIQWNPTDRQLRQFAVICLFALPAVGWFFGGDTRLTGCLAVLGGLVAIVGWIFPVVVRPVFIAFSVAATPIGMVLGELAMLIIYFGVFLPIGGVFRLIRRDALQLALDEQAKTYWQPKKQPSDIGSYYRQS